MQRPVPLVLDDKRTLIHMWETIVPPETPVVPLLNQELTKLGPIGEGEIITLRFHPAKTGDVQLDVTYEKPVQEIIVPLVITPEHKME